MILREDKCIMGRYTARHVTGDNACALPYEVWRTEQDGTRTLLAAFASYADSFDHACRLDEREND